MTLLNETTKERALRQKEWEVRNLEELLAEKRALDLEDTIVHFTAWDK